MKIKIAWIGKTKEPAIASLTEEYLKRISRYVPIEGLPLRDEPALLEMWGRSAPTKGGAKSTLVLMDSRGKEFSSEQFAKFLGDYQDRNPLPLVFAVGGVAGALLAGERLSALQLVGVLLVLAGVFATLTGKQVVPVKKSVTV